MPSFLRRLRGTWTLARLVRGQARYPFRPLERILEDQSANVRRMAAYAYENVPIYREAMDRAGLAPADFRTADDLSRLPLLERESYQRVPEKMTSRLYRPDRGLALTSAGSAGMPTTVHHDFRDLFLSAALSERFRSIIGALAGTGRRFREARLLHPDSLAHDMTDWHRANTLLPANFPVRRIVISMFNPPDDTLRRLAAFRPDVVAGYGSFLEGFLAPIDPAKRPAGLPRVVVYGADAMSAAGRKRISEDLGISVLSNYHAAEASRIGFECERHRGIHVNVDIHPLRIIDPDGRTLPPGEPGQVVVSNLSCRGTVTLNYRLGDIAAWIPGPCPCGRNLPVLSFPEGRKEDVLRLPSGKRTQARAGISFLDGEAGVWGYQVVQEARDRLRARLATAPGTDLQKLKAEVLAHFSERLEEAMAVDVDFVTSIERTRAGKHRTFLSAIAAAENP